MGDRQREYRSTERTGGRGLRKASNQADPLFNASAEIAVRREQVADDGHGVCTGVEHRPGIRSRNATDRDQRPVGQRPMSAQLLYAYHGIGTFFGGGTEYGAERHII